MAYIPNAGQFNYSVSLYLENSQSHLLEIQCDTNDWTADEYFTS